MVTAINNFIVDKIFMGAMMSQNSNKTYWTLSQISNPQLSISSDSEDVTSATGEKIMTIMKAKQIELSGDSAVFDLALLDAAAGGSGVQLGVTENQWFDIIDVAKGETEIELTQIPKNQDEITNIYVLTNTNSLGKEFTLSDTVDAEHFSVTFDSSTGKATITLPTDVSKDEEIQIFVTYAYDTNENATSMTVDMEKFPKAGRFVMEILGYNVCNKEDIISAYLIMPSAQLNCDTSVTFESQISQNFTIQSLSDYCTKERVGFKLVIPND